LFSFCLQTNIDQEVPKYCIKTLLMHKHSSLEDCSCASFMLHHLTFKNAQCTLLQP
jgi:hypothetical protein